MPDFELGDQLDHLGVGFRLREHEASKLGPGERSLSVKDHAIQILLQRELSLLVGVEGQMMAILHLGPLQLEVQRRPLAGLMSPSVGEQDTADIQKQRRDRDRFFHLVFVNAVCWLPRLVARTRSMAQDWGPRWQLFGSFQSGSSPATKRSCGASRKVSTARCNRAPDDIGGKPKSTASAPALNIRYNALSPPSWIRQANAFSFGSAQLGNPPFEPNHWISVRVELLLAQNRM